VETPIVNFKEMLQRTPPPHAHEMLENNLKGSFSLKNIFWA